MTHTIVIIETEVPGFAFGWRLEDANGRLTAKGYADTHMAAYIAADERAFRENLQTAKLVETRKGE